jgi:hypothetical protein
LNTPAELLGGRIFAPLKRRSIELAGTSLNTLCLPLQRNQAGACETRKGSD